MSVVPPPLPPAPQLPPGALACPRCGELLAPDQDWCLRCGDPARTVIAPTPRWRRPILAMIAVAALALGVLAAAFVEMTNNNAPPARTLTKTITTQPGQPLPPGVTPAPTTATTAPPATTAATTAPATQTATTSITTLTTTTTTTTVAPATTTTQK